MSESIGAVPFATFDVLARAMRLFAQRNNISAPELACIFHAGVFAAMVTQPDRFKEPFIVFSGPVDPVETGDWQKWWPELARYCSDPAQPVPEPTTQEAAHG